MTRDERILKVATKLFYERGFHAVGVAEIGSAAGISGPGLYKHFSSKDEILATILDRAFDRLISRLGGSFDDPHDELEHLVRVHIQRSLTESEVAGVHSRERHALAEPYRRRIERRERDYIQLWVDCLSRCYPSRSPSDLASATWAVISQISSVAFWPKDARQANDLAELLTTLVMGGLDALEPAAGIGAGRRPAQRARRSA
jgi:AcrR family transcriptional regulator